MSEIAKHKHEQASGSGLGSSRMVGVETPAALVNPAQETITIEQPEGLGSTSAESSSEHPSSSAAGPLWEAESEVCGPFSAFLLSYGCNLLVASFQGFPEMYCVMTEQY